MMAGAAYYSGERAVSRPFERFAGSCAIIAGVFILSYSISLIVLSRSAPQMAVFLSAVFLMLSGLLNSATLVAVCTRLQDTDSAFAMWALLLGLIGTLGSTIHGGYDLANALNPPSSPNLDLPSQIEPRGLLTFGVSGIATLVIAWLIHRGGQFPKRLGYLGYVLALLLVVIYLGRLTVLNLSDPILLGASLLAGFVVSPVWYIWLGIGLLRGPRL